MKIIQIDISGFGSLSDRHFTFGEGLNVIYGLNEQGKTTLHSCIRAMLFGLPRARGRAAEQDDWSRFKPWHGDAYGAEMRVEADGRRYQIRRDFARDPVGVTIFDETADAQVREPGRLLETLLDGLSRTAFDNSVSIGQLASASDENMAAELKRYILNLNTSDLRALNTTRAREMLQGKRRDLESRIFPEAARQYAANLTELKNIEKELNKPEYENRLPQLQEEYEENLARHGESPFASDEETEGYRRQLQEAHKAWTDEKADKAGQVFGILGILFAGAALAAAVLLIYTLLLKQGVLEPILRLGDDLRVISISAAVLALSLILFLVVMNKGREAARRLKEKTEGLKEILSKLDPEADPEQADLQEIGRRLDGFCQARQLRAQIRETESRQEELSELTERLHTLSSENRRLRAAIETNDSLNEELDSVTYALESLDRLTEDMKTSFALYLNRDASGFVAGITGGAYDSLFIDDELNIFMNTDGRMVPLERLSSGAKDQVYLAVRLAAARFLQGDREMLPLLLDDSFVNYDEDRLEHVLRWLPEVWNGQILLFTCHRREGEILQQLEKEFTQITL